MSHVDEGTLHAYLDGELPRVEAERVRLHLESCATCQGRLEEERALIERANRLLERAAPPQGGRPVPAFESLAPRSRPRLPYVPLAWAATLLLALGLGWYLRGARGRPEDAVAIQPPAAQPVAAARPADQGARHDVAAPPPQAREVDRAAKAMTDTTPAPTTAANPIAPPPRDEMASQAGAAARPTPRVDVPANAYIDGAPVRDGWGEVTADSARTLLGGKLVLIPGLPVARIQASGSPQTIVLVTLTAAGTSIQLYEQPAQDAQAANALIVPTQRSTQRLARYVGGLRVEIAGTLPADSLSRLLDQVR